MICSSPIRASVSNLEGSGTISVNTGIGQPATLCVCQSSKPIEFPPNLPDNPASASVDCPTCSATPGTATTTVGAVHQEASFSGSSQSLTFTAHGIGAANTDHRVVLNAVTGTADITFNVSDAPTVVFISASLTLSATGGAAGQASCSGSIRVTGPNGVVIGEITGDETGTTGSIPSAPLLSPGSYTISVLAFGASDGFGTFETNANVSASTSGGQDIHWKTGAGGNFGDANNWLPMQVPGPADTAIFDLANSYTISLTSASTKQIKISQGSVSFAGGQISTSDVSGPSLTVGGSSNACSLQIASGGLTTPSGLIDGPANTTMSVSGASSEWTVDTSSIPGPAKLPISIAQRQRGTLQVNAGGLLNSDFGTIVGEFSGSSGSVVVDGHAIGSSTVSKFFSPLMKIGDGGIGDVTISGGAFADIDEIRVGATNTGHGMLTITGDGTKLHMGNTAELRVGLAGQGEVDVSDGALLELDGPNGIAIGAETSGTGEGVLQVSGRGATTFQPSTLNATGQILRIGGAGGGRGLLEISNGATAKFGFAQIGLNAAIHLGGGLPATFLIDGGQVEFDRPSVEGTDQDLALQIGLVIGENGSLEIKNGGKLTSITAIFGGKLVGSAQGQGSVIVHDAGSQWMTDAMFIATDFSAFLRVTDQGTVSTNRFSVAGGGIAQISNAGTLTSVIGEIGVPLFGIQPTFAGVSVIGLGSVWTSDSITVGTSSDVPGSGFLQIDNGGVVNAMLITVDKSGVVSGNGVLHATQRVINHGTISPGLSPGQITIDGSYEQAADGMLKMEAAGLGDGQFDVLHVTGDTTLGGTLQLKFLNGYLPKTGDMLPLLQVDGEVTGDFEEVTFPQLAPGFEADANFVDGEYQLTALNDAALAPKLIKLSSHAGIKSNKTVLTTAFTVSGNDPTPVLIRALGPSGGGLGDPVLQLSGNGVNLTNDNWKTTQQSEITATGHAPPNDVDSAILVTLQPGTYTATLFGKTKKAKGVGTLEIFDLDPNLDSNLTSTSAAGTVTKSTAPLVADFTVASSKQKVLIRAIGTSLKDTVLTLANGNGSAIFSNDNWQDTQKAQIEATGLAPTNNNDSAIVADLDPGSYQAIVLGKKNKSGSARVDVISVP